MPVLVTVEPPRIFAAPAANYDGRPLSAVWSETKTHRNIDGARRYTVEAGDTLVLGDFTESGVYVPIGTALGIMIDDTTERSARVYWTDFAGTENELPPVRAAAGEHAALFWVYGARDKTTDVNPRKIRRFRVTNDGAASFVVDATLDYPRAPV